MSKLCTKCKNQSRNEIFQCPLPKHSNLFFRLMMIYFINKPSIWSFPSLIVILLQLVNLLDIAFFTTFEIHFLRSVIKFVVYIVHLSSMNHFLYRNIYPTYKMLFCSHFWLYIPLLLFQIKKKKIIFFHKVSFIT